jgi:hypothetical protein
MSSGIGASAQSYRYEGEEENVNFYQLESGVSTKRRGKIGLPRLLTNIECPRTLSVGLRLILLD